MTWLSSLRDYQRVGAEWLADPSWRYRGKLLADGGGLGKSRQLVGAARLRFERGECLTTNAILLFTPASARADLRREALAVWPELKVYTLGIDDKKLKETRNDRLYEVLTDKEPSLIIGSHEVGERVLDVCHTRELLLGTVIVDEAHRLKNTRTQLARSIRPLIGKGERTYLSTGTPVHNRAYDLHNLLDLIAPGKFKSRGVFVSRYYRMIESKWGATPGDLIDKAGLANAIEGFVLARSSREAFPDGLPPTIHKLFEVDVTAKFDRSLAHLSEDLRYAAKRKLPEVIKLALDLDEPLVIFTHERAHANAIAAALIEKGDTAILATGDSTAEKRVRLVEEWKHGKARVLVATMDALRESATLTRASVTIFADLDYLPGKMVQCAWRTDPARQPADNRRPARYFYVVCSDGVDRIVAQRVIGKIEEMKGIVSAEESSDGLKDALSPMMPAALHENEDAILADLVARLEARADRMEEL